MKTLTPFELRESLGFPQSISIVGNARSLLGGSAGKIIDKHDCVVRFNQAKVNSFEIHVGTKTDLLICNMHQSLSQSPSPKGTLNPRAVLCYITQKDANYDLSPFIEWAEGIPTCVTLAPDLGISRSQIAVPWTTGIYGLQTIMWLFNPVQLFVTGFDFFGRDSQSGHYWNKVMAPGPLHHNVTEEAKVFFQLLKSCPSQLSVGADIQTLADRVKLVFAPHRVIPYGRALSRLTLFNRVRTFLSWRVIQLGLMLRWKSN